MFSLFLCCKLSCPAIIFRDCRKYVTFVYLKVCMLKLFLISLSCLSVVLSCQSLMHVRYYSAKDGLSQNTVADFLQDDKGYIWVATMEWIGEV